jgi:hypothetical protein
VIRFAVELPQLRLEVRAHFAHDRLHAFEVPRGEHRVPVPGQGVTFRPLFPFRRVEVLRTASVVRVCCSLVRCGFGHQP